MKRLKLTNIGKPQKGSVFTNDLLYTVNLGNGIHKKFTSMAKAQAFLNEVSKNLTYKMHECNKYYCEAFTYYRGAWFYFDHEKLTQQHNLADLYKMERECENSIDTIRNAFTLLHRRCRTENGNYFVFNHFYNILDCLDTITRHVSTIYATKSVGAMLYELEVLRKRIAFCRRTIENYTIELENSFIEVEKVDLKIVQTA